MFGVSDATNLNTVAIFTEGDAAARTSGGHMDGTAYLNGTSVRHSMARTFQCARRKLELTTPSYSFG